MTREFLENLELGEGVHLHKSAIDAIMGENDNDIENHKNTIATLTAEKEGLEQQLTDANAVIKSYKDMDIDGIQKSVSDWEAKYNADTEALKKQLDDANYRFSVEKAVSGFKFSSVGAKKSFLADLTEKKLPLQDGKLLGIDDFVESYKKTDPGAFVQDEPTAGEKKLPKFTNPTQTSGSPSDANPFTFGFTQVRQAKTN